MADSAIELQNVRGEETELGIEATAEREEIRGHFDSSSMADNAVEMQNVVGEETESGIEATAEREEIRGQIDSSSMADNAVEMQNVVGEETESGIKATAKREEIRGQIDSSSMADNAIEMQNVVGEETDLGIEPTAEIQEIREQINSSSMADDAVEMQNVVGEETESGIEATAERQEVRGQITHEVEQNTEEARGQSDLEIEEVPEENENQQEVDDDVNVDVHVDLEPFTNVQLIRENLRSERPYNPLPRDDSSWWYCHTGRDSDDEWRALGEIKNRTLKVAAQYSILIVDAMIALSECKQVISKFQSYRARLRRYYRERDPVSMSRIVAMIDATVNEIQAMKGFKSCHEIYFEEETVILRYPSEIDQLIMGISGESVHIESLLKLGGLPDSLDLRFDMLYFKERSIRSCEGNVEELRKKVEQLKVISGFVFGEDEIKEMGRQALVNNVKTLWMQPEE